MSEPTAAASGATPRVGAVQSVDRAMTVLEIVAEHGECGISEIAAALDVHKSTASRLVAALERRSLVEQHGDRKKYALSFGLIRLAAAATARLDVSRLGRPVCQRLAESLGETVNIAVSDGEAGITVAQESGTASVVSENWVGRRTPLHASSAGKVLLAWMDPADRRRVLRRPLERFTEETIVSAPALRIELARVFDEGHARSFEELEVGMHAVAVPVFSGDGSVGSSLSVTGPAYRLPRRRARAVVGELREAAAELSAKLGHTS
ncbi:IclR family transcriptional regulator [Actinomycetospora corticicola]|uniref:DNA-binding IclR family transcriptional regulator n=1 Tax=Actinomycetospora corticicola TaxID=663602 RepID=A0A7Y9DV63_9PSEU|nr:IclR family transcriptional regulator [Actinomycetospora corticicola]NYD36123.1 DNA-binding IclR family transcriptional regulator [Actinomycetospora corticicola]